VFELPFSANTFDIIWSEGAIFIIGFEQGLREWKPFLKLGGYLVLSELAWITPDRPDEIQKYLEEEYPSIKNNDENSEIIRKAGYILVSRFILPEKVWQNEFYQPFQSQLNLLKKKYAGNKEFLEILYAVNKRLICINNTPVSMAKTNIYDKIGNLEW